MFRIWCLNLQKVTLRPTSLQASQVCQKSLSEKLTGSVGTRDEIIALRTIVTQSGGANTWSLWSYPEYTSETLVSTCHKKTQPKKVKADRFGWNKGQQSESGGASPWRHFDRCRVASHLWSALKFQLATRKIEEKKHNKVKVNRFCWNKGRDDRTGGNSGGASSRRHFDHCRVAFQLVTCKKVKKKK